MIQIEIPKFKIRCSAIGKIMGGALTRPTEKQLARISELEQKEKLTDKQQSELSELRAKRDAQPKLQAGAKTYCEDWLKEQIYERTQQFSSKYIQKGIECEQGAIDFVSEQMGYGMVLKNTERREDEYMTGEPDMVLPKIIEDTKASWSCFTFPLFATELPETDYFFQGQGYMSLFDRNHFAVNYCLMDAPSELVDMEARKEAKRLGMSEVTMELWDEVYASMKYSHMPVQLRWKRFEFDRDDKIIAAIRQQVRLCREYIAQLTQKWHMPDITLFTPDSINGQDITIVENVS